MAVNKPPALPGNHPSPKRSWIPDEILKLPYFHIDIVSSDTATAYIKRQANASGMFLLRQSSKGENYLTLSVSVESGVHHVQVYVNKKGTKLTYNIVPELTFSTFNDLYVYYSKHRIGNLENIDNVRLEHPLGRRARTYSLPNIQNPPQYKSRGVTRNTSDVVLDRRPISLDSNGSEKRNSDSSGGKPSRSVSFDHSSGGKPSRSVSFDHRPPQPLPERPRADGSDPYYSGARDENPVDRARELQDMLRNTERCDCGLLLADAELGCGWAVHKSRDAVTHGRIFFQNAEGETAWKLPNSVIGKLPFAKIEFLVKLYRDAGQKIPFDEEVMERLTNAFMY